jgi:hypothetical protein
MLPRVLLPSAKTTSGGGSGSNTSSATATSTKSGAERRARDWLFPADLGTSLVMSLYW